MSEQESKSTLFTCKASPISIRPTRWIAREPNGSSAGDFPNEAEAREAVRRWNETGGHRVVTTWKPSTTGYDSDRGTYTVSIEGTNIRRSFNCGWHTMEAASRYANKLRDAIAKHGLEATIEIASSLTTY